MRYWYDANFIFLYPMIFAAQMTITLESNCEFCDSSCIIKNCIHKNKKAFTLVELSIVLVIIGLIIGGVLVGRDLIVASEIRSQIAQIEKYQTAINTFKIKYRYLPGDIPNPDATQLGFTSRSVSAGAGNGDMQINSGSGAGCCRQGQGELVLLWRDLSDAKLIGENFSTATCCTYQSAVDIPSVDIKLYLPNAKLGAANYVYAWADAYYNTRWIFSSLNFLGISSVTSINNLSDYGSPTSTRGLTVAQAYHIDSKMDDGFPQSGKVLSVYVNGQNPIWSTGTTNRTRFLTPEGTAISASATSCFDNGGVATNVAQYTRSNITSGSLNCGLSFRITQ